MQLRINNLHILTFTLTIVGLLITIAGNFFDISVTKKMCYLIGVLFLLTPAILEKNTFFTILETILLIGTVIAFLHISFFWKSSIPIGLGIIAACYFGMSGQLTDHLTWLAVAGILLGTWGYAVTAPLLYCSAGAVVTTYSFCAFRRGEIIALAFGILNSVFTLTAFLEIIKVL